MMIHDYDGIQSAALVDETVLRLVLGMKNTIAFCELIESYLKRKSAIHGLGVFPRTGRYSHSSDSAELNLLRSDAEFLFSLSEKDSRVGNRSWITSLAVDKLTNIVDMQIGVQQNPFSLYASRQTPKFLHEAVNNPVVGLCDNRLLVSKSTEIDESNLPDFLDLVGMTERVLPVLAVSIPNSLDTNELTRRMAGAAHIFTIDREASFQLTNVVGKSYSVFDGGLRIYPAKFNWSSNARNAPLWLGSRLSGLDQGLPAIERVIRMAFSLTTIGFGMIVQNTIAASDRRAMLPASEAADARVAQIEQFKRERDEALASRDYQLQLNEDLYKPELAELEQVVVDLKEQAFTAGASENQWRLKFIDAKEANGASGFDFILQAAPMDAREFETFLQDRYDGRLVLSPAARRFYKDGKFEDYRFITQVLDSIATKYFDLMQGVIGAHEQWEQSCIALHLKHGLSATPIGANDDHRVKWNGRNDVMYHVRSQGKTYDPRRMLYIGFIFDETSERIVIGRMPSKPETMADNT